MLNRAIAIAVPGLRVKADLSDQITVFGAVFNGNAAAPGDGDPQLRDNHGLAYRINDPRWVIGQVRWSYDINVGSSVLPGNFTPGGWRHYGEFDDQRFTVQGLSIADPNGTGIAAIAPSGGYDIAWGAAVQADGRIVIAGSSPAGGSDGDVVVARYNTDGSIDASFGGSGLGGTAAYTENGAPVAWPITCQ